ncbi:MAG: hypothetical protein ACRYFZ_11295 [Janthinobacterium lividum]
MKKLLYLLLALHLTYVGVINAYASYNLWRTARQPTAEDVPLPRLLYSPPARYYGRLTGAEHGYGFFGLNVRSNGALLADCGGQKLEPTGRSFETSLRLITLANTLTDEWLKPTGVAPPSAALQADYQALVLRNVALTLHQQAGRPDTVLVLHYNLLSFPTLAEVRRGAAGVYTQRPLLTARYTFRHHAP